jgi:hypothetical protein
MRSTPRPITLRDGRILTSAQFQALLRIYWQTGRWPQRKDKG